MSQEISWGLGISIPRSEAPSERIYQENIFRFISLGKLLLSASNSSVFVLLLFKPSVFGETFVWVMQYFPAASNIGVFTVCIIMSKLSWLGFAFVFCTLWKYKTDTCSYNKLTSPLRLWNRKANYPRKTLLHLLWDADPMFKSHFKSACWNLLLVLYASVSVVFTTQHVVNTCVGRGNITKQHTITE